MADRSILFSAPMVRALLDDTKTQTRRALRPQPFDDGYFEGAVTLDAVCRSPWIGESDTARFTTTAVGGGAVREEWVSARFGRGDRLWVREAYYQRGHWEPVTDKRTKGGRQKWAFIPTGPVSFDEPAEYRKGRHHNDPATVAWHKRLGRFMPRSLSRLTLTVTDVRVERLQNISEADALAEGIYRLDPTPADIAGGCTEEDFVFCAPGVQQNIGLTKEARARDKWWPNAPGAYGLLWNHINGPGAWEANPWVVAVSFEVGRHNIDAPMKGGAA